MKKKIITVVITMFIGIIQFMPFSSVSAATRLTYTSNNVVGEIQWTNEQLDNASNGQPSSTTNAISGGLVKTTINVNWGVVCSGSFTIVFNAYNSGNAFLCQDCKMTNYGQLDNGRGTATFSFYGQDYVQIVYYHAQANWYPTTFSGTWNKNSNSVIESIEEITSTITSYLYNGTDNYNYLWSIDGLLQDIVLDIDNSIIPKLNSMNNTLSTMSSTLNNLFNTIKLRDSVDIPLYSRFAYINLLRFGELSDQYNYPYNTAQYGFFPTILTSNYSSPDYNSDYDIDIPAGKTLHFIYTISYWANIFDFIDSSSNSLNPTVTMIEGNNYYRSYDVSYTNNTSSRIFVNISMSRNINRPVIPLYLGITVPQDVAMLFNIDFDNTYTRLLEQIKQGINDLSFVNNTTQTTINSNVNNYNDYITEIHNIENNYITQFNNYKNDINTPTLPSVITNDITNYKTFIDGFFNGVPYIKTILTVILFCFLIVCLLGV